MPGAAPSKQATDGQPPASCLPCCSTVTGGLTYYETLGSGQRQGMDDVYAAEVGGGAAFSEDLRVLSVT